MSSNQTIKKKYTGIKKSSSLQSPSSLFCINDKDEKLRRILRFCLANSPDDRILGRQMLKKFRINGISIGMVWLLKEIMYNNKVAIDDYTKLDKIIDRKLESRKIEDKMMEELNIKQWDIY